MTTHWLLSSAWYLVMLPTPHKHLLSLTQVPYPHLTVIRMKRMLGYYKVQLLLHWDYQLLCESAVVQSLSHIPLFAISWTVTHEAPLSFTLSQHLLKFISIESVMLSNYLILCCPLLLQPLIFPNIRVSSNESALHIRQPKQWSFSFSISPSSEYSGLISFRIDWFDLADQGILKGLLQHHNSKASILQCSLFFMV